MATKPSCVIFDLDGTLALLGDRSPYDASKAEADRLNDAVHFVYTAIVAGAPGTAMILLSGRSGRWRPETERWLAAHSLRYDALYMREAGDRRPDTVVKREIYETHIAPHYTVRVVFEDRDKVVRLWRDELHLPCFQVAWGDF
ncbi:MAG: hypothetical protein QM692_06220 [Thermomicrobiales bacterium]